MKFLHLFILIFFFVFPIVNTSAQSTKNEVVESESPKQNLISIHDNIGYKHLVNELKKVVKRDEILGVNHFFVAKYPENQNITYMVWREGRHLWILNIDGGDNPYYWTSVEFPKSGTYLNFDKDVVATKEEIGSSTYLVDQAWINERVFETVINGDLILIDNESPTTKNKK